MFNNGIYPYMNYGSKAGLFSALKRFNWGNFLTNTQKTLGVINQAIPIVYQIKPIWNNTKTVFKIMGAIRDDGKKKERPSNNQNTYYQNNHDDHTNHAYYDEANYSVEENKPNFFL